LATKDVHTSQDNEVRARHGPEVWHVPEHRDAEHDRRDDLDVGERRQ
jgi:hypothetical protein